MSITIEAATIGSPVGALSLYARNEALCGLVFADHDERLRDHLSARFGDDVEYVRARDPAGAVTRVRRYLAGELDALDDIAVDLGGTPFQARVWAALRKIPVGATWSYATLARKVGSPEAVRAVGAANGRNPVSLVVPCHRVIASDGTLCGYGGGIERKRWLLTHERALLV
ncbi:MAG: methylated-DNA--[protein]-cysteine S-methyltransferase [Myxococcales bacterium]|nr:methylated-DNA--[protein]-cysteine S-methyltransferase [Myxococcales bacterium]